MKIFEEYKDIELPAADNQTNFIMKVVKVSSLCFLVACIALMLLY